MRKQSVNHKWLNSSIKDLTIADALYAWIDGVEFVCGDGKLKQITGKMAKQLLGGKGVH